MTFLRRAAFIVAVAAMPLPAFACRLALVLAVDVSTSVDQREYALQRNGLAGALRSAEVKEAFLASGSPVALAAYEWSGQTNQRVILDWTLMNSAADMDRAAARIESFRRRQTGFPTSLGRSLSFGRDLLSRAPVCARQTLDVSGDGRNNDGYPPEVAYQNGAFEGIGVNALAIGGSEALESLVRYFETHVIRGRGAFVETARNHEDFEAAMRRKLIREVTTVEMSRAGSGAVPLQ